MSLDLDAAIDQAGAERPAAKKSDALDTAIDQTDRDERQQLRAAMYGSLRTNPDEAAEAARLGEETGLPRSVVERNLDTVRRQARLEKLDRLFDSSPTLARHYQDAGFADLAHDDAENLSHLERLTTAFKRGLTGTLRGGDVLAVKESMHLLGVIDRLERGEFATNVDLAKATPYASMFAGVGRSPENLAHLKAFHENKIAENLVEYRSRTAELTTLPASRAYREFSEAKGWRETLGKLADAPITVASEVAVESLGGMLPTLPFIVGGGAAGGVRGLMGGTFLSSGYTELVNDLAGTLESLGADANDPASILRTIQSPEFRRLAREASIKAGVIGAFDAATAGVASVRLRPSVAGNLAAQTVVQMAGGAAGEAAGAVAAGQEINPSAVIAEAIGEVPGATVDVATLAGRRLVVDHARARAAERDAAALKQVADAAEKSKLKARSPETFGKFLEQSLQTSTDGPVPELYIDAQTLAQTLDQAGVDLSQVAEQVPAIKEQIGEALATGGDVRIPVGEFAARIVGSKYAEALLPHLRTSPEAMSQAEAQVFFQEQDQYRTEIERLAAEQETDLATHRGAQAVEADLLGQLNQANRFTADVNRHYAALIRDFYATQAQRLGTTPEELFKRHPLKIQAEGTAGDQALAQVADVMTRARSWVSRALGIGPPVLEQTTPGNVPDPEVVRAAEELRDYAAQFRQTPDQMVAAWQQTPPRPGTAYADFWSRFQKASSAATYLANNPERLAEARATLDKHRRQQERTAHRRGFLKLAGLDSPATVVLLKNANLSTFIHEAGHFFLEVQAELASQDNTPAQVREDMDTVLRWFGIQGDTAEARLTAWRAMTLDEKRESHEQFARGFEAYAFEGKAPSLELQTVFARFRAWLLRVYRSLKNLNVELTDEVRQVLDRMLATDERIKTAEQARGYRPLFKSAEQAKKVGLSSEWWKAYGEFVRGATQAAVENLERRNLRDLRWLSNAKSRALKALQGEAAGKRAAVRGEVEAEIAADPAHQVRSLIERGMLPPSTDPMVADLRTRLATEYGKRKLSLPALKELYGDTRNAPWRALEREGLAAEEGVHPDDLAPYFGFTSGDELARRLAEAGPTEAAIERFTDERVLERYGDLATPEAIEHAAEQAIRNDVRARFLATEHEALAKATGGRALLLRAAKDFAASAIARRAVRDVRPAQFEAAEARAAREAEKAFRSGDTAQAADHKRRQVLQNQLARAAYDALEEIERGVEYLKKFDRPGTRKNLRGEFLAQLDALLARFDLRTSLSAAEIDAERVPLAQWVKAEAERLAAVAPEIPASLLNEAYRKHYRSLTVEEFRGLVDTVRQIEKLARREQQAYIELRGMTFEQEETALLAELRRHNPQAFLADGEPRGVRPDYVPSVKRKLKHAGDAALAEFLNVETLLQLMSGGELGQLHESLFGRLSARADWKISKLKEIHQLMKPLFDQYGVKERLVFSHRGYYIPEIGTSLTRENMLVVALHYGNPEGRLRLLQGHGWSDAEVRAILDHLDEKDWRLADGIWRLFDENLWPELKALNERTRGLAPPKVEALPYPTRHGQARGGYFRIKYDATLSERAHRLDEGQAVQELLGGGIGMPRTAQGTSQARMAEVKRPMRLDLGVMSETVNETVHDLAFREAVADTWRLVNGKRLQAAIKTAGGTEVYRAIVTRLRETAAPPRNPTGFVENSLAIARRNTLVVAMGLSVKTALVNMTGILPAFSRVNAGALLRNLARFYSPRMAERYRFVIERSEYMKNRHDAYERDVQDAVKRLSVTGGLTPEFAGWFKLIEYVDKGTSTPTWLAAFEEELARNGHDEARAIEHADHVVRQTHGSGRIVDLAAIQSGHGGWGQLKKTFTMFYSYFNAQLGLLVRSGVLNAQKFKAGDPYAVARLAADFTLIVVLPAVLAEIASGRCDDADDDGWGKCIGRAVTLYASAFVPIWRDVAAFTWSLFDQDVHRYGFRLTPAESYFEGLAKGAKAAVDTARGEGDEKDARDLLLGSSYLLGLPGYQAWRTIDGINAVAEGEAGPQAILLGPPRR